METVHPTNPRIYDTFMDAILAGAMKPNVANISMWMELWNSKELPASKHDTVHEAFGFDLETYEAIVEKRDENALKDEVKRRRDKIDDVAGYPLHIRFGVPSSEQESGGANATLTDLPSGHSISIAVIPPDGLIVDDIDMLRTMLRSHFARLIDNGYKVGVEVGPNDQDPSIDFD